MNNAEQPTIFERISTGIRNSISLKLMLIMILVLLLLIPMTMIRSIIHEREDLRRITELEVSDKWARSQVITGPILSVPLLYEKVVNEDETVTYTRYLHILPETLKVNGKIDPKKLSRGIYEVTVYSGNLDLNGSFQLSDYKVNNENLREIQWSNAFLTLGISDLRGIRENIPVTLNNRQMNIEPGSRIQELISSGVTVPTQIDVDDQKNYSFAISMKIQGSEQISFVPLGKESSFELSSSWPDPSFNGSFIPDSREIGPDGFSAKWNILQLNRNYPQKWIDDKYADEMNQSAFGVQLFDTMDDYQKSIRSAKYAVLTLALTFLIFFLTEVLNKRRIHPFQYTLVGLALCIFYVLLVSLSEHIDFNIAYWVSSVAIIGLITFYAYFVFKSVKVTTLLSILLTAIYAFVFVTLQLSDFALLIGSIGLLLILGATMFYTRNINWYKLSLGTQG